MDARETLTQLALDLGFDVAGWAGAQVEPTAVTEYRGWLDAGRQAGMDYLERQLPRRADLGSTLEGARSVLVLGISHAFGELPAPCGGLRLGRVARYAWTPDYHGQLQPLLERLEREAHALGLRARGTVDHAPVMERELAGRAFLGWRARSGMLVSTKLGAFLTLAALLTDLPFEGSETLHPDRCGRCRACVSACPTGAIQEDRTVDARLCVSYLTIEHRGPVEPALRPGIGDWLFGCDGCLEVCPWSLKAGAVAKALRPDPELAHPDLLGFFGVSEREFARRFADTAFLRPRRKGMARNAVTVVGNSDPGGPGRAVLEAATLDPAWEVREAAAWAWGRWGEPGALTPLLHDPDERVRAAARRAFDHP